MSDKSLKIGDAFVICDAGGGTVDLISYEIAGLKPLELKELVAAKGKWERLLAFDYFLNHQMTLANNSFRRKPCWLSDDQSTIRRSHTERRR